MNLITIYRCVSCKRRNELRDYEPHLLFRVRGVNELRDYKPVLVFRVRGAMNCLNEDFQDYQMFQVRGAMNCATTKPALCFV